MDLDLFDKMANEIDQGAKERLNTKFIKFKMIISIDLSNTQYEYFGLTIRKLIFPNKNDKFLNTKPPFNYV